MADAELRRVVRCLSCRLNQFETANGRCRRCGVGLPKQIVLRQRSLPKPKNTFDSGALGRRICGLRKLRRLTQQQLADSIHQNRTYVCSTENYYGLPSIATLLLFRDALGTSLNYLILGNQTPPSVGGDIATFGPALAELRRSQRLSQGDVEKQTGIARSQLSTIENGHVIPHVRVLLRLHKVLNFSFDSLVGAIPQITTDSAV